MKPLIVIPARGGSKGVPRKNIKPLLDKPLIHYTIDAAQQLFDNDLICVTTDSQEIIDISEEMGIKVPFVRPLALASDTAGSYEVLLHAVSYYEIQGYFPDTLILLQPTSPFRTGKHIQEALKLYSTDIDMVVAVKQTKSNPYYNLFEENENGFLRKAISTNINRRQDSPKAWEYNGAIYIINITSLKRESIADFKKIVKYEMDEFSSHDIDTYFDWEVAEFIIKKKHQ